MTVFGMVQHAPKVLLRQTKTGISLHSERTTKLAALLTGRPLSFARTVLPNVLGLCPVAHAESFEAACEGRAAETAALRIVSEAMLEAVRVFVLQWCRFAEIAISDARALPTIGRLRQQLFAAMIARSDEQSQRVYLETKQFVREFQSGHEAAYRSLCDAAQRFDGIINVDSRRCLAPSELRSPIVLDGILDELQADRDFGVRPRWRGARVLGGLARECERGVRPPYFSMRDVVRIRWEELGAWSSENDGQAMAFVPQVRVRDDGWRLSTVETVRGTLLHAVRLKDETLDDFHMVAPTEWVFQPNGELVERLNNVSRLHVLQGAALQDAMDFVVTLFDACTDVDIVLEESYA